VTDTIEASAAGLSGTDALFVTDSLDENAAAREAGLDTVFLLGRANALRDIAFCPIPARPTYVAMDSRAVDLLTLGKRIATGAPPAEISPRGRPRLHRPVVAPPHEVLEAIVSAAWRSRDRRSIMLTGRADLWRDVEWTLRDYWNRWISART